MACNRSWTFNSFTRLQAAMCARLLSFSRRVYARISVKGRIRKGHRHLIHVRVFMSVIRVNVNDAGFKG